ncbi:hypothetical protein CcI49_04980 [Frankia sp. CcI49]|uniref:SDR family NAD(P)-dependent oxidoreductase n=1 Tax=Frankia sp. CcI49 TaxID=1745382 RepID=UPI0006DB4F33|nr:MULTISPECIES: SDR family NAD(P)-dependent oxidoreductase [unclassified Frankia]KPM54154.1 hypothetical protein ACG83_19230 [Frankia sp. R43]ONH61582.1 hypothetical protein CcI49_04980 [Frankia sp. CcI49]
MNSRVAIVTGGGSGIGAAIARRLAVDGLAVAVFDLNGATAEETAALIAAGGGRSLGLAVDVTDSAAIQAGVDSSGLRVPCPRRGRLHHRPGDRSQRGPQHLTPWPSAASTGPAKAFT